MPYTLNDDSLRRLKDWKIKNFQPVFRQFGVSFRRGMAAIFSNTAGRVNPNKVIDGIAWEPLKPEYKTWKSRIVPFGTLVFSGEMADSFREKGARGNIERIDDFEASYGSSNKLAKYHQYGTKFMPARQIVFPSRKRNQVFKQTLLDYFQARFEQLGINVELKLNED
ncbi:phage virion morphogenesis protein [Candidatus Avelusimicrobium fimicolum]|uniref:phage virion morphogenesis protein n=1 Tax=Candidatus Avelusimicrobium fimicolum TaxID=3416216 RepID=UPI003D0C1985